MSNSVNGIQVAQVMFRFLSIVLLLLACGALSAQNQDHRVQNIVLVHGAWADGSGWKGVYDILVNDGFRVSIVQEPETSFKDDVAATKRVLVPRPAAREAIRVGIPPPRKGPAGPYCRPVDARGCGHDDRSLRRGRGNCASPRA